MGSYKVVCIRCGNDLDGDQCLSCHLVQPQTITYTQEQVEEAIENILGKEVNHAMKLATIGTWRRHMAACLCCFEHDRRDKYAEILRGSWRKLGEKGCYD